jgi:hypothetical protein
VSAVGARWRELAWGAAVTLLAPLVVFRQMLLSGFGLVPGNVEDGRLNAFFLEHTWGWVSGKPLHRSLWGLPIFFPGGGNAVAYSDVMLSFGPLYWPWRALGLPADTSYQLWCLAVLALSALAAWLFLRRSVGLTPPVAALGAWLACCAASRLHQISHSQLLPLFFVFAGLGGAIAWARGESRQARWTASAVTAGSVVAQLWGGFYQGLFLAVVLALLTLLAVALPSTRTPLLLRLRADWAALLVVGAIAGILLVPWVRHYAAAQREVGRRPWEAVLPMVPRPASWLFVSPHALAYRWTEQAPWFTRLPWNFEHAIGLGLLTTACVVAAAILARRRLAVLLAVATSLLLIAVTTMVHGHTLWRLVVRAVPPLAAARAISRIGLLLPVAAAVVLGCAVDGLRGRWRWLALALLVLCAAEQLSDLEVQRRDVQRFWEEDLRRRIDPHAEAFVATRSSDRGGAMRVHLDAMFAADLAGVPTVNGVSGNEPPGWYGLQWARVRNAEAAAAFREALDRWLATGAVAADRVQWIRLPPGYRGVEGERHRHGYGGENRPPRPSKRSGSSFHGRG